jgi:16S rRNA (guanine527-N7)-methyltransferase
VNALALLEAQAAAWGIGFDDGRRESLLAYARILASYDRANVIGTRDLGGILLDHVLDSLSCFLHEPLYRAGRLADIGSGGGLPGIPIHIARRDLQTTLVESVGKKARFLRYAVEDLGLGAVEVANVRAEDLGREPGHRGAYDVVTSRAVARLSVVVEYSVPLLEVGGSAIVMKGRLQAEELSEGAGAAGTLGAEFAEVMQVPLIPELGAKERNLVILTKTRETPQKYPRRSGTVAKKPLGD